MSTTVSWLTGGKSSISGVPVQVTSVATASQGVQLTASSGNPGTIFVGLSTVTPGTVDGTDGYALRAGDNVFLRIRHPSDIYAVASNGNTNRLYFVIM